MRKTSILRVAATIAALVLVFALAGCGSSKQDDSAANDDVSKELIKEIGEQIGKDTAEEANDTGPADGTDDGETIVLKGSIRSMNSDEVMELQGKYDETLRDSETYILFVLDTPRNIELPSSGGGFCTKPVIMVRLEDFPEDAAAYADKTVKIRFVKKDTWWPSDVSLPLGEPRSNNYEILQ